jgi:putative membrane protein
MPLRLSRRTGTGLALALALPLALAACGNDGDAGARDAAMRTGALADTAALSATAGFVETSAAFTDAGILAMLDEANQSDSMAAALAIDKATDPEVKAFAMSLMEDHHALRVKGEELVERLSITPRLPATDPLAPAIDDEMIALRAAAGEPQFDRVYLEKEVIVHRAIADFAERARRSTPNEQIRHFIDQMVPVVRHHLARAQALQKKLERTA